MLMNSDAAGVLISAAFVIIVITVKLITELDHLNTVIKTETERL